VRIVFRRKIVVVARLPDLNCQSGDDRSRLSIDIRLSTRCEFRRWTSVSFHLKKGCISRRENCLLYNSAYFVCVSSGFQRGFHSRS